MASTALILSIHPSHAAKIFAGRKRVELRRTRPRNLDNGALALIYVTSPVRSLAGAFRVTNVVERPVRDLWKMVKNKAGLSFEEFMQYYKGVSTGTAIFFQKVWSFHEPMSLEDLRNELLAFLPPRTYRYLRVHELTAPGIARLLAHVS